MQNIQKKLKQNMHKKQNKILLCADFHFTTMYFLMGRAHILASVRMVGIFDMPLVSLLTRVTNNKRGN